MFAQIQCMSLVLPPHVSPQHCRMYSGTSSRTPQLMTPSGSACSAFEVAVVRVRERVLERVRLCTYNSAWNVLCTCY